MEDPYLRKHVNKASQQLVFLLSAPQDTTIYASLEKSIEKIKLGIYRNEAIFIETLTEYLLLTANLIQNIAYFHPDNLENTWFNKKIQDTLSLFEELGEAISLEEINSSTQLSTQIIHNVTEIEGLEIHLLLTRKRSLIKNKAQFFSIIDLIYTASHTSLPLNIGVPLLLEKLCFALFQLRVKTVTEQEVIELWDRLILLTDPLATREEKIKWAYDAFKEADSFKTYPTWYEKEFSAAEVAETQEVIKNLEKSTNLQDYVGLFSDSFFLFQSFKQHYLPKTLPYIALASFARSCLIMKNLAFALPLSEQHQHLKNFLEMAQNLLLFLENLTLNSTDIEKMVTVNKACALLARNYKKLITVVKSLKVEI